MLKKILFFLFFFRLAIAQEIRLPKVYSDRWDGKGNLIATDTIPCPNDSNGFYMDYYELPFSQFINEPIIVTIYGNVPYKSNLRIFAIWDEEDYGLSNLYPMYSPPTLYFDTAWASYGNRHRYRVSLYMGMLGFHYHYIGVGRESHLGSDYFRWKEPVVWNGLPCIIDSVTVGLPIVKKKPRSFYYYQFLMRNGK